MAVRISVAGKSKLEHIDRQPKHSLPFGGRSSREQLGEPAGLGLVNEWPGEVRGMPPCDFLLQDLGLPLPYHARDPSMPKAIWRGSDRGWPADEPLNQWVKYLLRAPTLLPRSNAGNICVPYLESEGVVLRKENLRRVCKGAGVGCGLGLKGS